MRAAALLASLLIAAPAAAQEVDLPEGFVLKPLVLGLSAGTEGVHQILPEEEGLFRGFTVLEIERIDRWAEIKWSGAEAGVAPAADPSQPEPVVEEPDGFEYLLGVPSSLDPPVPPERPSSKSPGAAAPLGAPPQESATALGVSEASSPEIVPGMRELDAWLLDRLAGETGPVADLGLLLLDEDSPFAGASFDDVRPDPDEVADSLRRIASEPEAFCAGPRGAYNLAAATRELDCSFRFGRFRSHLLLRLHRADSGWLLVRARAANSERYRQLLLVADSLRPEE